MVDAHLSVVSVCLDEDAFEAGLNVVDVVIVLQGTVKKIERKQCLTWANGQCCLGVSERSKQRILTLKLLPKSWFRCNVPLLGCTENLSSRGHSFVHSDQPSHRPPIPELPLHRILPRWGREL